MNARNDFLQSLFGYLSNQSQFPNNNIIICRKENCDFNFPTSLCIWKQYLNLNKELQTNLKTIFDYKQYEYENENNRKAEVDRIIIESKNWSLQIEKIQFTSTIAEQCEIFLNRQSTFEKIIQNIIENEVSYGKVTKNPNKTINIELRSFNDENEIDVENQSIVIYRSWLIHRTLLRLLHYSKYTLNANELDNIITVSHRSTESLTNQNKQNVKIICGTVKDGNKMATVTALDYIKKRCIDMQLVAEHKYGLRIKNEKVLQQLMDTLGKAAATVDLLEVKHSSPLRINSANGSSRGAAFILYNSARIETLFKTFYSKVESGYYPQLPPINKVDTSLLKEEEEWRLLFNYVLEFPILLQRSIYNIEKGLVAPHLICNFLNGFATTFSIYYRRVKILTANREHLLPILYARIYLLQCVRIVLNKCLLILGIDPVQHM